MLPWRRAVRPYSTVFLVTFALSCKTPRSVPPDATGRVPLDGGSESDGGKSFPKAWSEASVGETDAAPPSGQDERSLSDAPFVMDAKFRGDLAPGLVAQVERADWAAFLPAEGTTLRQGARVNLAGSGLTAASWTRACTAAELEARHADLLRHVARDLTRKDRQFPEDGFTCMKNSCTAQFGEMGFNGELVFARAGDAVHLLAVSDHDVLVTEDVQRAIDRANRALRPPPACRRR